METETIHTDSTSEEAEEPSAKKRKRVASGHKIGYQESWSDGRPWLYSIDELDAEGNIQVAMMCSLCKRHAMPSVKKRAWVDFGCKTLRRDKVTEHEISRMHVFAIKADLWKSQMNAASSQQNSTVQEIVEDAMQVVCYLVQHNLSLYPLP